MLHSSIILSGESYTFEDQDKSIVRCFIKQRTCLFSLERWPHLEIFHHKTILVACKKFQLLIYNTKRYKVITIQVFTKKKHGIIHLSQRKQTCKEFFVQCIFFNRQKAPSFEDKKHTLKSITRTYFDLVFSPCFTH